MSENGYLFSGALQGWRQPKLLRTLLNSAAKYAYRIPVVVETQALAYLFFLTQPQAGDTVTIGDNTYTWQLAVGNPGDVQIGIDGTTLTSAQNLMAAVTADNDTNVNAGSLYGNETAANSDVQFYLAGQTPINGLSAPFVATANIGGLNYTFLRVGSTGFGAGFNKIGVAESTNNTRTTWLMDALSFADTTSTFAGGSNPSFTNDLTEPSQWLEFLDQDTNVVKSQVADDQYNRYYFASPSDLPKYNTYDRIVAGMPPWLLGIPPPACSPVVSVAGGGNSLTLGNYAGGGGEYVTQSNTTYLIPITPTGATQLQDVQFSPSSNANDDPNCHFAAVLYEDDNGVPGGLLNTGEIITGFSGVNANESAFVNPSNLLANTQYWIGIIIDSVEALAASNGGNTNMSAFTTTFTNGPPETAPAATPNLIGIQMWGDCITDDVQGARAYVYTWVSDYKEEGPPSPAAIVDGWSNGTWTVDLWQPPANDQGVLRNITSLNLYRTVVGVGGNTVFFFVANLPVGTTSYTDTQPDSVVSLNNQLATTTWFPPPSNLQGLTTLPNGMMAGFVDNEIWFCQPYFPHAWPPGYVLTTDFPIVGLGVTDGALVACTAAKPYVINGVSPGNMSMLKCSAPNPCNSRGSILSDDGAVSYMSPNGLIQVTNTGQAVNTTDLWFTRENWKALTPPNYGRAIHLASCYFCFGSTSPASVVPPDNSEAQSGFTIELDQDNTSFTIWPQPGGHRLGFNELTAPNSYNVDNVLVDPWTAIGLVIQNGGVYFYDFSDQAPVMVPYTWRSKIYQQNTKKSYEAMKVFFTVPANTPPQNKYRNEADASDPSWQTLQTGQLGIIRTYVDIDGTGNMTLVDCREIRKSGELLRLVSGFKAEQWQWEITGRVVVSNVQVATSAKELGNV